MSRTWEKSLASTRKIGTVSITGGERFDDNSVRFHASSYGTDYVVDVTTDDTTQTASVAEFSGAAEDEPKLIDIEFAVDADGNAHDAVTLPTDVLGEWVEKPATAHEVTLACGADASGWFEEVGGTTSTDCPQHAPNLCVRSAGEAGVALIAMAATRVIPVLSGFELGDDAPWLARLSSGARSGAVHGGGGTSVAAELELYDKLLDAVKAAVLVAGPVVEYGIVEHHFAFANMDDYRELHRRYGQISVDQPMKYSLSAYLAQLLGNLSRQEEIVKVPGSGTGYWGYNSNLSHWRLPDSAIDPRTSWANFAASIGFHPGDWVAASLIWGEEPVTDRSWCGHVGPGESEPLLHLDDIPEQPTDQEFEDFRQSFDAETAFGPDLLSVVARIREQHGRLPSERSLPKDTGMLRAALAGR